MFSKLSFCSLESSVLNILSYLSLKIAKQKGIFMRNFIFLKIVYYTFEINLQEYEIILIRLQGRSSAGSF